ncbi:hypothetical protein [Streptomyces sp. NPDC090022]|uniref:hypothetical protein n=1 Tax=Streptomyces sp. NPDC090022 TaxID=3365920 RepID=UPI0037FBBE27
MAMAQIVLLLVFDVVTTGLRDDHGVGHGGTYLFSFPLLFCFPPLLVGLGYLHALTLTVPAVTLSRRLSRRFPGVRVSWLWPPVLLTACAAVVALLPTAVGAPYTASWACLTASGLLPLVAAEYARRRGRSPRFMLKRTAMATGAVLLATLLAALLGADAWTYRPPRLPRAEYVGTWTGDAGARLVLRANGEAVAEHLPVEPWGPAATETCSSGAGTWEFTPGSAHSVSGRDAAEVRIEGCAHPMTWEIAGTREAPHLFVLLGDPDTGDLHVLRKR